MSSRLITVVVAALFGAAVFWGTLRSESSLAAIGRYDGTYTFDFTVLTTQTPLVYPGEKLAGLTFRVTSGSISGDITGAIGPAGKAVDATTSLLGVRCVGTLLFGATDTTASVSGPSVACNAGQIIGRILGKRVAGGQPAGCSPQWLFIGTRGSSETANLTERLGAPDMVFIARLKQAIYRHDPNLDRADVAIDAAVYPAVSVPTAVAGRGAPYFASRKLGELWLQRRIGEALAACSGTRVVLAGYSQGADVTASVYAGLGSDVRRRIFGVVLFGDPEFNPSSIGVTETSWQQSQQGSLRHSGILGERAPFPSDAAGRILTYCHRRDPVCQGVSQLVNGFGPHHYEASGDPEDAANYFSKRLP